MIKKFKLVIQLLLILSISSGPVVCNLWDGPVESEEERIHKEMGKQK